MKSNIKAYVLLFSISVFITACGVSDHNEEGHDHSVTEESEHNEHEHNEHEEEHNHDGGEESEHEEHEEHEEEAHLSEQQFQSLSMKVDILSFRNMTSFVEASGILEVQPQYEAAVTAIIGANITSIVVKESDKVNKGQVLAYISHPDLINLQTDYINSWHQLKYLEKDYQRQNKLYEENVASGKDFQKTHADYLSMKGVVMGYEAQFKFMGLKLEKMQRGELYEQIPIVSPLEGYVGKVKVKTGQYVQPQTEMFEVVNIDRVHADFMVFERDMHKIKEGQKVIFSTESLPGKELEASIYAVGKSFEQNPKAIHLHAEIKNKDCFLIPGMYVRGRIITDNVQSYSLPEEGVVREGDKHFIFQVNEEFDHGEKEWAFKPIEVLTGTKDDGWIEIKLLTPLPEGTTIAWNNAYYLLAEMKKGEAGHEH